VSCPALRSQKAKQGKQSGGLIHCLRTARAAEVGWSAKAIQEVAAGIQELEGEVWRSTGRWKPERCFPALASTAGPLPRLSHCLPTRVASAGEPEYLEESEAVGINP